VHAYRLLLFLRNYEWVSSAANTSRLLPFFAL
jgi:hypothetical protein